MRRWSKAAVVAAASWCLFTPQADALSLLGGGTGENATFTWQQINAMGKLNAHNGRLVAGCHMYPWTYSIHPPAGMNWEVDVFISGPGGKQLAASALMRGADGLNGTRYYKLCSAVSPKGTYTITSEMNLWGASGVDQHAHLPTVHYTLN